MLLEKGRVVYITRGRLAGMRAVVISLEGNRVKVKLGNKEKMLSIRHVFPTQEKEEV